MTPEKWDQIEEIFSAALRRELSERAAFLNDACGPDRLLREVVESLLDNADAPLSIIDTPLFQTIEHLQLEGKTIDHYRIISRTGSGGMGEVYLAEDERLGRKVAIKMLSPIIAPDESHIHRMQKEARVTAALKHPNIVTIYDIGQEDSLPFIAMEFIEGETLRERMGLPMPIHEVVSIGIQIASGLAAAHQAGILHRDIKPENIMIDLHGDVKILDFGIAQLKDPISSLEFQFTIMGAGRGTQASIMAGTPGYFSPEQASGEPLDARTDIFSLGVLLFEMATGHRPFEGETLTEVRRNLLANKAQPLIRFRNNIPSDFERIVSKALMNNRAERYQSVTEMLNALNEFSREAGAGMDATQRANRMFREYLSIYAVDKRALIPLTKLYFINRHSDIGRGERGRELLRRSLRWGVVKAGLLMLSILLATTAAAAILSVNETWDETILKDGHSRAVRQLAFSPDGRLLVSVGEDAKVIVWDFQRRMPLAVLTDHTKVVTSVAFSPDGKWFATGSEDQSVIIWDAMRLEKAAVLSQFEGKVVAVAVSPDGRLLATAMHEPPGYKGRIKLWRVGKWDKVTEIATSATEYGRLMFIENGRKLVWTDGHTLDVNSGQAIHPYFNETYNWIARSPAGDQLLAIGGGGDVHTFDLSHNKLADYVRAHQDSGRAVDFSPDGRLAATGADDIILWDPASMTKLARFEASSIVWNVAFSPDGRWLVSAHGDSSILVWDVVDRKLAGSLNGHAGAVRGVAFSSDGKLIASASEDRSVIVWNADTGRKVAVLQGPTSRLTGVAFSPNGDRVASSDFRDETTIWNKDHWQSPSAPGLRGGLYCVAISPDGKWIATSYRVYDAQDGHQVFTFRDENNFRQMYGVAFSPDGHWLAGASANHSVTVVDTQTWKLRDEVKVPEVTFISVSFSPDNKYIVTGEDEGAVRLWSIQPLHQIAVLGHQTSRIKSVAFAPDGRQVVSAGDDNAIRLWDINGHGLIREIGTHTKPVLSVAYAPDGKRIVSGEHDFSVRLYARRRSLWGYRLD